MTIPMARSQRERRNDTMAKKAITYILNDATLQSLVNHADKDALNRSYWYHHDRVQDDLTKTEKEIFFLISKYSVKYYGVSYMSHATVAERVGCSTKTVQRAYRRLEELGVIERFETKRPSDMKQTANIVRILPYVPVEETVEEAVVPQDVQQATGENVQPKTPSLTLPSTKVPTFEGASAGQVSRSELAEAFDIPSEVVVAVNSLRLEDNKFVELFGQDGKALLDKIYAEAYEEGIHGDLRVHHEATMTASDDWRERHPRMIESLRSAAVRTSFMQKQRPLRNPVGYFLNTFWDLYRREMVALVEWIEADFPDRYAFRDESEYRRLLGQFRKRRRVS